MTPDLTLVRTRLEAMEALSRGPLQPSQVFYESLTAHTHASGRLRSFQSLAGIDVHGRLIGSWTDAAAPEIYRVAPELRHTAEIAVALHAGLHRARETLGVARVVQFDGDTSKRFLRGGPPPGFDVAASVSRATVPTVAAALGLDLVTLPARRAGLRSSLDAKGRAAVDLPRALFARGGWRPVGFTPHRWDRGTRRYVILSNGVNPAEAARTLDALGGPPTAAVCLHEFHRHAFPMLLAQLSSSDRDELLSSPIAQQSAADTEAALRAACAPIANLSADSVAAAVFHIQAETLDTEARLGAACGQLLVGVLRELSVDGVVLGHEAFVFEQAMLDVLKAADVPVLSLGHTGIRPISGYALNTSGRVPVTCWNETDQRHTKIGPPPTDAVLTGSLRHDDRPSGPADAPASANPRTVVLVTAAVDTGLAGQVTDLEAYACELGELLRALPQRGYHVTVKRHPEYDYPAEWYSSLAASVGGGELVSVTSDPLPDVLASGPRACVLFRYPTTAGFEATMRGIETYLVGRLADVDTHPDLAPNFSDAFRQVEDHAALLTALNSPWASDEWAAVAEANARILGPPDVSERLLEAMEQLCAQPPSYPDAVWDASSQFAAALRAGPNARATSRVSTFVQLLRAEQPPLALLWRGAVNGSARSIRMIGELLLRQRQRRRARG